MIHLRATLNGGQAGFTVLELLIAMTVVLLLAGALASAAPSARQVFDRVPAELDQQQRGRTAIDSISQMVRSATSVGDAGDLATLTVVTPVVNGGIEQYTYRLASQADGSHSLIRETAAGAVQPMVDFVTDLSFTIAGNRVDVSLTVEAATTSLRKVLSNRVFKTSVRIRNQP
jgi:prepilin-type N-terminal cleavage/methylation domain-containing protein